jgi:hypothetical protein
LACNLELFCDRPDKENDNGVFRASGDSASRDFAALSYLARAAGAENRGKKAAFASVNSSAEKERIPLDRARPFSH